MEKLQVQDTVEDYVIIERIGAGSFAVVWKARHRITGLEVAIKEIATHKLNKKLLDSLESEISILEKSNHPNIVKLFGKVQASDRIFLILEYCAGGDLSDYIRKVGKADEETVKYFMRQLGTGLKVLREHNLIHRDLKPQNLLLSSKLPDAILKIADFGFARSLHPQGMAETLCGSPLYMAPEILQFQKYDAKADLWSVGTILYELLTGRPPFGGQNHVQLLRNIEKKEVTFPESVDSTLSHNCKTLCRNLLKKDPVQRLSFEEFFKHPFINLDGHHGSHTLPRSAPCEDVQTAVQFESIPLHPGQDRRHVNTILAVDLDPCMGDSLPFALDGVHRAGTGLELPSFLPSKRLVHSSDTDSSCPAAAGTVAASSAASGASDAERRKQGDSREVTSHRKAMEGETVFPDANLEFVIEKEYVVVSTPLVMSQEVVPARPVRSIFRWTGWTAGKQPLDRPEDGHSSPVAPNPALKMALPASNSGTAVKSPSSNPEQFHAPPLPHSEPFHDFSSKVHFLQNCANYIGEIALSKRESGDFPCALSLHLLSLATWRKALEVCQDWATSASTVVHLRASLSDSDSCPATSAADPLTLRSRQLSRQALCASEACSVVEREFMYAVERAEGMACLVDSHQVLDCPEPVELLFQCALALARNAAVEELMGNTVEAELGYSKATSLLNFILFEAQSLSLNPPFLLFGADKQRIERYVSSISLRQMQCSLQMATGSQKR